MVRGLLDTGRNPIWREGTLQLFLAERRGRPVGRIAAIENRTHNRFHGDRVGFFGFFECVEDQEVADALIQAARGWLRDRGLAAIRGPVNPSTNHDCGLLVRGFRFPPMFLTPWNPRYYPTLVEGTGLSPVRDLLGYFIPMDPERFQLPESVERQARRAREREGMTFRDLKLGRWREEVELLWEVYNQAWERNWGFVPYSREEFLYTAQDLKRLLRPEFAFVAEVEGEAAGFMLIMPDYNRILETIPGGRLLPTGLPKLLLGKKRLLTGRLMALGVKPRYRRSSIFPLFAWEAMRRGRAIGALGAEASWILEDNEAMNAPLRGMGLRPYRRWRIYEGHLE